MSTPGQVEGTSLDEQLRQLRAYSEAHGFTIIKEYVEEGESGATTQRTALKDLLVDAALDKFDIVLVGKLDRFGRSAYDLLGIIKQLDHHNVRFISLSEQFDMATSEGKLMFTMLGAIAEFEASRIKDRMFSGRDARARSGAFVSRPPLGYRMVDHHLTIDEEEALKVRKVFTARAEGKSLSAISVETAIPRSTVQHILRNRTYLGEIRWRDEWVPGLHKPLVTEGEFEAANAGGRSGS